jgi:hypothetical protein
VLIKNNAILLSTAQKGFCENDFLGLMNFEKTASDPPLEGYLSNDTSFAQLNVVGQSSKIVFSGGSISKLSLKVADEKYWRIRGPSIFWRAIVSRSFECICHRVIKYYIETKAICCHTQFGQFLGSYQTLKKGGGRYFC